MTFAAVRLIACAELRHGPTEEALLDQHRDAVCVIGAGSSGIVATKVLRAHGIPVVCYEKGSGVGGNWRFQNDNGMSAAYRSLHINTSKERMAYSDFPMPDDYPDYPHHSQVLEYFENYVDHFGVRDAVQFQRSVESVGPVAGSDGRWRVDVEGPDGPESREFRAVLVANGHHWSPNWPSFEGSFDGRVLHAHEYKTPEGYADKNVCVVGIGNSGVDIACEVSRIARKTWVSTRRSAHVVPKYAFGRPIDQYTSSIGSKLPLKIQNFFFEAILKLTNGSQERFGVPLPKHRLLQAHPTISSDFLHQVGHGEIEVKPNVAKLDGDGIVFEDGSREDVDILVYATGYQIRFPFLSEEIANPDHNSVRLYRNVVHPERNGLYFIGLVQPLGAVMPISEAQSEWVARLLAGRAALPDRATMEQRIDEDKRKLGKRYVTSDRHTIQVDFYPYLETVQKEATRTA